MSAAPPAIALALRSVVVTRGGLRRIRAEARAEADDDRRVLDDVALELARGEAFALLGESGGGKSTLLKLAARLVEAEQGEVEVLGRSVSAWPVADLRRAATWVPQQPALFGGSVREELIRPIRWRGLVPKSSWQREALAAVGLSDVGIDRPARELSGGQQTRLCLARALLLGPQLLLLDEPTGSLDVRSARELGGALRAWAARGTATLLCATHRPEEVPVLADRGAVLLGGRLHGPFPAGDLAAGRTGDREVDAFLGKLHPAEATG